MFGSAQAGFTVRVDYLACVMFTLARSPGVIIFTILLIGTFIINRFKSTQSAAQLKVPKHVVNGRYLLCKSLPRYL